MHRHPTILALRRVITACVALLASLAACGGDGDASGTGVADDECNLVELDTLDSAIDIAGELGGETVAGQRAARRCSLQTAEDTDGGR